MGVPYPSLPLLSPSLLLWLVALQHTLPSQLQHAAHKWARGFMATTSSVIHLRSTSVGHTSATCRFAIRH